MDRGPKIIFVKKLMCRYTAPVSKSLCYKLWWSEAGRRANEIERQTNLKKKEETANCVTHCVLLSILYTYSLSSLHESLHSHLTLLVRIDDGSIKSSNRLATAIDRSHESPNCREVPICSADIFSFNHSDYWNFCGVHRWRWIRWKQRPQCGRLSQCRIWRAFVVLSDKFQLRWCRLVPPCSDNEHFV